MKQILGFLLLAIKWLSRTPSQIQIDTDNKRYVLLDDVNKAIELAYFHWLHLSQKYRGITASKNSSRMREKALLELHYRIQALIKERPELNGYDVRKGSPFFELISLKALSKKELIEKHGRMVLCIEVDLLKDLILTIITYNFFKKYKTRAMELFTEAESKMKKLVEDNKLPGRFSWNTFVIKDEKQKDEEFDSSALNQYGDFDDGNSEDEANSKTDTDSDSPEII